MVGHPVFKFLQNKKLSFLKTDSFQWFQRLYLSVFSAIKGIKGHPVGVFGVDLLQDGFFNGLSKTIRTEQGVTIFCIECTI
jgi:hypothetical protein